MIGKFKSEGYTLLQTASKVNQLIKCGVGEAVQIVLNSPSWVDHNDSFIQQQTQLWSEIEKEADETEVDSDGKVNFTFRVRDLPKDDD